MTTSQISDTLMDIYGFEVSESFISDVTDKILPQIKENAINGMAEPPAGGVLPGRLPGCEPLDGIIRKLAAYVILGITLEGKKEVLSIQIGENETSKYWLSVLNGLKNRGVKDILKWIDQHRYKKGTSIQGSIKALIREDIAKNIQ